MLYFAKFTNKTCARHPPLPFGQSTLSVTALLHLTGKQKRNVEGCRRSASLSLSLTAPPSEQGNHTSQPKCTSRRVWQGRRWKWRLGKTAGAFRHCGKPSSRHCRSCASRGSTCLSADVPSTATRVSFHFRSPSAWTWWRTAVASAFLRCVRLAVRSAKLGCLMPQQKVMRRCARCTLMLGCRLTA